MSDKKRKPAKAQPVRRVGPSIPVPTPPNPVKTQMGGELREPTVKATTPRV